MIGFNTPVLVGWKLLWWLRAFSVVLALAAIGQVAAAKSSQRLRVFADASLIDGLIAAPVPNYPAKAAEEHSGGFGVFELYFQPDGTVREVLTLLTTGHKLLDDAARASLLHWRHKPGPKSTGRMTMSFSIHHEPITLDPIRKDSLAKVPVHPFPTYPLEARRQGWIGTGLFVMRFRQDGGVEKVVALKSTGHSVLDEEAIRTLQRWRCLPEIYVTAYIPVTFTLTR